MLNLLAPFQVPIVINYKYSLSFDLYDVECYYDNYQLVNDVSNVLKVLKSDLINMKNDHCIKNIYFKVDYKGYDVYNELTKYSISVHTTRKFNLPLVSAIQEVVLEICAMASEKLLYLVVITSIYQETIAKECETEISFTVHTIG